MQFEIERNALLGQLQMAASVAGKDNLRPQSGHLLLKAEHGNISVVGTDGMMDIRLVCPGAQIAEAGELTTPADKLAKIWQALPAGPVQVSAEGQWLKISAGELKYKVVTSPASEYPTSIDIGEEEEFVEFTSDAADILQLMQSVSFAMARNDVRYFLNGMLFEIISENGSHIRAVATDSHRLAVSQLALQSELSAESARQAIIPAKGIVELQKMLADAESVQVSLNSRRIQVVHESAEMSVNLIDGQFPDYSRVCPFAGNNLQPATQPQVLASVDRKEVLNALRRVSIVDNASDVPAVRVRIDTDAMHIDAKSQLQEKADDVVPAEANGTFDREFNERYLRDIFDSLSSDRVSLGFTEGYQPILLAEDFSEDINTLHVIMPLNMTSS